MIFVNAEEISLDQGIALYQIKSNDSIIINLTPSVDDMYLAVLDTNNIYSILYSLKIGYTDETNNPHLILIDKNNGIKSITFNADIKPLYLVIYLPEILTDSYIRNASYSLSSNTILSKVDYIYTFNYTYNSVIYENGDNTLDQNEYLIYQINTSITVDVLVHIEPQDYGELIVLLSDAKTDEQLLETYKKLTSVVNNNQPLPSDIYAWSKATKTNDAFFSYASSMNTSIYLSILSVDLNNSPQIPIYISTSLPLSANYKVGSEDQYSINIFGVTGIILIIIVGVVLIINSRNRKRKYIEKFVTPLQNKKYYEIKNSEPPLFCSRCGNELKGTEKYCTNCGYKLK